MGCATSKQPLCRNCQAPCSSVSRSYSMHVHHPPEREGDSYHVVALTSSTLGSLMLDSIHHHHHHITEISPQIDRDQMRNGSKEKEFSTGLTDAKTWSAMIDEKIPKFLPKTPIRTPPGEPETINAWELMEGLEDTTPPRPPNHHLRSFSFHVSPNPIPSPSPSPFHRPKSKLQENGDDASVQPIWPQLADNNSNSDSNSNSNEAPVIFEFDPDVISTFRKELEELPPANPFHLKPLGHENDKEQDDINCENPPVLDVKDEENLDYETGLGERQPMRRLGHEDGKQQDDIDCKNPPVLYVKDEENLDSVIGLCKCQCQSMRRLGHENEKQRNDIDCENPVLDANDEKNLDFETGLGKCQSMRRLGHENEEQRNDIDCENSVLGAKDEKNLGSGTGQSKCRSIGKQKVVLYFTSLRGVRKTYEDCCHVRVILKGLGVRVDERDVSMHLGFREELKERLRDGVNGIVLPRVFVGESYVGGADEIRRMHEEGRLEKVVEGCELVDDGGGGACEACGDVRFVPCETCSGSCKVYYEDDQYSEDCDEEEEEDDDDDDEFGFQRCPDCNENGLIRCPICCD